MTTQTIAIIDYGSGNLRSAEKAFSYAMRQAGIQGRVMVTSSPGDVMAADKIVLPGQGAFADCMSGLQKCNGMHEALGEAVLQRGAPFFGICVGMQLLATRGLEFGEHKGLGWIPGTVRKMEPDDKALKIPHMGWNELIFTGGDIHPVLRGITKKSDTMGPDFYFVHSFVFDCIDSINIAGLCDYGGLFTAMVAKDNIIGTQFHPEKSQKAGMDLIAGFLNWNP